MNYFPKKMCRGSLLTIALLLSSVSTTAVILIVQHASKANQLSKDSSKYETQRTISKNIAFTLSKELDKIISSMGSSTQPFTYSFVNNSDPTKILGTYQETPTDSSALNVIIMQSNDDSVDLNNASNFKAKATSKDRTQRNKIGQDYTIIRKTITSAGAVGGYALKVDKVNINPLDSTSAIYSLLVKGYACDNGDSSDGSCSSSSIMGDYSIIVFKKRKCINTNFRTNGTQLVVASNPGTDFYNLQCTCPTGKSIQADGTCILLCPAGKYNNGSSCQDCTSGTQWSLAGATSCSSCSANGCGAGFGICDVTKGCTACPGGKRLSTNSCLPCDAGTSAVTGANVCTPCNTGSWSIAGSSSCITCTSSSVTACNASTGGATSCNTNYQLSGPSGASGTTCIASCPSNCQTCSSSTVCTLCNPGWYLKSDNTCTQSCPSSTYPNSTNRTCSSCPPNCNSCTASNNCSQCSDNTRYWDGSQCATCPEGAITNGDHSFGQMYWGVCSSGGGCNTNQSQPAGTVYCGSGCGSCASNQGGIPSSKPCCTCNYYQGTPAGNACFCSGSTGIGGYKYWYFDGTKYSCIQY